MSYPTSDYNPLRGPQPMPARSGRKITKASPDWPVNRCIDREKDLYYLPKESENIDEDKP